MKALDASDTPIAYERHDVSSAPRWRNPRGAFFGDVMPVNVKVRSNVKDVERYLTRIQRRQIPFATSLALTETGKDAKAAVERRIERAFDRPTRFTQKAIATKAARKSTLRSLVFVKDRQADYLEIQERGGTRVPLVGRKAFLVPVGQRTNKYGNLPRNVIQRLKTKPNVFIGTVNGTGGVWQRRKNGAPKLLISFKERAVYRPRFGFNDAVVDEARRRFPINIRKAVRRALATAR